MYFQLGDDIKMNTVVISSILFHLPKPTFKCHVQKCIWLWGLLYNLGWKSIIPQWQRRSIFGIPLSKLINNSHLSNSFVHSINQMSKIANAKYTLKSCINPIHIFFGSLFIHYLGKIELRLSKKEVPLALFSSSRVLYQYFEVPF